jgi:(p)ppGpp synthase/HD superfamily hydrolase
MEMLSPTIEKADTFAADKHRGQTRRISGEPYVEHCRRVAHTVFLHTRETDVIVAALLHDTLEDTATSYEELRNEFGVNVADMVRALTNDEQCMASMGGKRNYLASKVNELTPNQLLIKLADRLDNISDLGNNAWSHKYCEETRHIFLTTLANAPDDDHRLTTAHLTLLAEIERRVVACEARLRVVLLLS